MSGDVTTRMLADSIKQLADHQMETHQEIRGVGRQVHDIDIKLEGHLNFHNGETTGKRKIEERVRRELQSKQGRWSKSRATAGWIGLGITCLTATAAFMMWFIRQVAES